VNFRTIFRLFKQTVQEWQKDKAPILAAALTYHTLFSIAPLFVIAVAIAGFIFGKNVCGFYCYRVYASKCCNKYPRIYISFGHIHWFLPLLSDIYSSISSQVSNLDCCVIA